MKSGVGRNLESAGMACDRVLSVVIATTVKLSLPISNKSNFWRGPASALSPCSHSSIYSTFAVRTMYHRWSGDAVYRNVSPRLCLVVGCNWFGCEGTELYIRTPIIDRGGIIVLPFLDASSHYQS